MDKKTAAISQLASAIFIWFQNGDPVSVHTLAAAANDCFHAIASNAGRASIIRQWTKRQPETFQARIREAQNFFKHGLKNLKGEVRYPPMYGEFLMFDSVVCYGMAFHEVIPPLLRLYAVRFCLENVSVLQRDLAPLFLDGIEINELAQLSRQEFFEQGLRLFTELHSGIPPKSEKP